MGSRSLGFRRLARAVAAVPLWPWRVRSLLRVGTNRINNLDERLAVLENIVKSQTTALEQLSDDVGRLTTVVDANHLWSQIQRGTAWGASAPLQAAPRISVVLPTRNRFERLGGAIESIRAQSYPHWDLVIIDDGSTDKTDAVIADAVNADGRIRSLSSKGVGGAEARNVGLKLANGEIVAFLDDDNTMAPHWLRAVAEFMGRNSQCQAIYGAQLRLPDDQGPSGAPNFLFIPELNLDTFIINNSVDLGMIAVRADNPQLYFDPKLRSLQDWEMFTRIAATTQVIPVPALASCYSSSAPDRITDQHGGEDAVREMRKRLRRTVDELQNA